MATASNKFPYGSVVLGGKKIPLTKAGNPNGIYLTKEDKQNIKDFNAQMKKEKRAIVSKELLAFLKGK